MSKTSNPTRPVLLILCIACISSLLIVSCNPITRVSIPVPNDTSALAKIDHFIPEAKIKEYRAAFRYQVDSMAARFPSLLIPDAEAFNKPALIQILKDPRCVGIRIYHGVKIGQGTAKNEIRVILVGVDSQGKDILVEGGSPLATDITQTSGGEENGQCPSCQTQPNGN